MTMPFTTSKITAAQAHILRDSIGRYASYPPEPDRPMRIERIEPLAEPIGDKTHILYAELGVDSDGLWMIKGTPIRLTKQRLAQTQIAIGDRLAGFLRHLSEQLGDAPLNLDDVFVRADIRDRARASMRAALLEDGYSDINNLCIRFVTTKDTNPPEVTLAMRATVTFRGISMEISGPQSLVDLPSIFPEDR